MTEVALPLRRPVRATVLRPSLRSHVAVAGALFAAGLLTLLWVDVPAFDAQGWLNWGRQILEHAAFSTLGYPSWKPLPLLGTVPLAAAGPAAPALWLALARAITFAGVLLAARLAARQEGPIAGVLAAASLLLCAHLLEMAAGGLIEPIVLTLLLAAWERHLAGRRGTAVALLALAALGRTEVLPLLALYGLWTARERRSLLVPVLLAIVAVIGLWLGGDWIGSGSPTHGGYLAREAGAALAAKHSGHPSTFVLGQARDLLIAPVLVAAAVGIVLAIVRLDWLTLTLTGGALVWIAEDMVLAQLGYAGERGRFLLPAAGIVCVIAGIGAVRLVRLVPAGRLRILAGTLALAAALPFAVARVPYIARQLHGPARQSALSHELDRMVERLRHRPRLLRQRKVIFPQFLQTRLSWDLGLSNVAVQRALARTLVFALPGTPTWQFYEGGCRPPAPRPPVVGRVGRWLVIELVPARYWAQAAHRAEQDALKELQ